MWHSTLQTDPLWERLLVAATGPAVTVLVGGLVVWGITGWVTYRREESVRRRAEEREDVERWRELDARDDALRHELVDAMTASANSLYLMTQHYWRAKKELRDHPHDDEVARRLADLRPELDEQYLASRASGQALEYRLWGYFESEAPQRTWHRVQDLLTVRYFQLIDRDTPTLYERNEGPDHTGLMTAQLREREPLFAAYHEALKQAVALVFSEPLARSGPDQGAAPTPGS